MSNSKLFCLGATGFLCGVLSASLSTLPSWIWGAGLALALSLWVGESRLVRAGAIFLLGLSFGALRLQMSWQANGFIGSLDRTKQWEGIIAEDIDIRPDVQQFIFKPDQSAQELLVITTRYHEWFYGDRVWITGKVQQPKASTDFDYSSYLERFNVYGIVRYPKVVILKQHQGNWLKEILLRFKSAFVSRVGTYLPEPRNSLLIGILIGARKTLPTDVVNNFNITGVSHVIAISGYNISIIISSLEPLVGWVGRKISLVVGLLVITGFVVMTGASSSVVRAAIMGALLLLSSRLGRSYAVTPSLLFSAAIMVLINPRILYWDSSFQLSFAATAGVIYLLPVFEELTAAWPSLLGLKSIVCTTLAATATTLPLILVLFGRLSLVAPLVNVLILPLVPLTMLLGFLIGLPGIGKGFAYLSDWLLKYMLKITGSFASWKYASVSIRVPKSAFWGLATLIIGSFLLVKWRLKARKITNLDKRGDF